MTTMLALLAATIPIFRDEIRQLVWTRRGTLLVVTAKSVTEIPGNRSRPLSRYAGEIDDPIHRPKGRLLVNASRTQATGDGFLLNLDTLASKPLRHATAWQGNRLVEIEVVAPGHYRLRHKNRSEPIAPGWFVLGISHDLRLVLACRREPFDGDTTFLLRRRPRASLIRTYPNASDDHNWLNRVERYSSSGPILAHSENLAGNLTTPFRASAKLQRIVLPRPKSAIETTSAAEWIEGRPPWLVVQRQLMFEAGDIGLCVDLLDLWNASTGKMVRLAKTTTSWSSTTQRGKGSTIGPYAIDALGRQIAYVEVLPGQNRVIVRPLP